MYRWVVAKSIDKTHFTYLCQDCSKFVYKNGNKRLYPKLVYHRHGSCGDLSNRIENRTLHCENVSGNIDVVINDETIRK